MSLAARRSVAAYLVQTYQISERRSCRVVELSRSTRRREPGKQGETGLVKAIEEFTWRYPRMGYRKVYQRLRGAGWSVSRERVRLIRKREGWQVVKKQKKKRVLGVSTERPYRAEYPNHVWSYDFVFDRTGDGRTLKCLTVVDEYTREGLAIQTARSITSGDVIRVLEELFQRYGAPVCLRSDNGPELVAKVLQEWLSEKQVGTHYIDPGSPWQNPFVESFNSVFRDGCLDRWWFYSVQEARRVIGQWLSEYNNERPHGSLNGMTPAAFAERCRVSDQAA